MSLLIAYVSVFYLAIGVSLTGVALALFEYLPKYANMIVFPAIIAGVLNLIIKYMISKKKQQLIQETLSQYAAQNNQVYREFDETDDTTNTNNKKNWIN